MIQTVLLGLFFGTIGTTIGGIIGIFIKKVSNKFLSFILAFASGLMLAVVAFNLIPEALNLSTNSITICGILIGIIAMIVCKKIVNKKFNTEKSIINTANYNKNLLKTGIIVSIGLALHNIPEGLAIGTGFEASNTLGLSLAIAICMHDIPEGISMALPLKNGGMNPIRIMFYVIMSGLATGLRSINRSISWKYITRSNINKFSICSRSNVIFSIR